MAEWLKSLILGIIQGLTEYLPVSSSGHIELGQALLNHQIEEETAFSVILHLATVLSTIVVFRTKIFSIIKGLLQFKDNDSFHYSAKIILSMLPAGIIGVLFNDELDALFNGQILLVGIMMWVTAFLLYFAQKAQEKQKESIEDKYGQLTYLQAFGMGFSQMIALLPGLSRSGTTISTGMLLKVDKGQAAEFSFLMVIPLILGKVAKDLLDGGLPLSAIDSNMIIGFIAAFIVGIWACTWMVNIVKKGKLVYFSIYCMIVGTIAIIASFL